MKCAGCGHENREAAKFCEECAAPLKRLCASCGSELRPAAKFCDECGASLAASEKPKPESQKVSAHLTTNNLTTNNLAPRTYTPDGGAAARIDITAAAAPHEVPEGERKTVTALFADIKGSMELLEDLDPEEARALVDPALTLMMEAVHRYGGYIVQSTGDGIFALFGAPIAHEDHVQRALYAALRLQEELKRYSDRIRAEGRLPIQARVGANTGEVVVRTLQTGERRTEYTPIGHATSLAARMQALAPVGSIATTDQVRKLCEGYFVFKALGPTRVKGVSEPVPIFEVTGLGPLRTRLQRAVGRGLTKFIGRQRELEALRQAAEQAKAGHGQLVAVVGEAGVGKSRLFYEFKAIAQADCLVLETFSVSHGKASAYLPVIELLHGYFDIHAADDARKRREKVGGKVLMLDRSLEDTLPFLFAVLGLVEGEDPLAQMEAQLRRRRTLEAIKRLVLRESVNQPLLVLIEDLHWIDAETQALLNLLADALGTAKMLLLVNYRPEYTHGWGSKSYYTQVRLDPLGRESAEEMLAALLGAGAQHAAPLQLMQRIIEQTEGNPFFMEEIVQSLFEEGALVLDSAGGAALRGRADGAARAEEGTHAGVPLRLTRPVSDIRIPATVQGMLAARIDRLPPEQKELLQTLAVLGKEFTLSLVEAVTGRGDDDLTHLLGELQLGEFIYEQPAAGAVAYTFKHALTQEVAYHSVLSERRKRLHERAGDAIEALGAGRAEDHLMEVAHHYSRSGNVRKAVDSLGRAGRRAAQQGAYGEAVGYLTRALELLPQLPESADRARHELELGQSLAQMLWVTKGTTREMIAAAARVASLAEQSGTLAHLIDSVFSRWQIAANTGDFCAASALADQALDLARREGSPTRLAMAHYLHIVPHFWLGDLACVEEHFTTGLAFFDDPGFRRAAPAAVEAFGFASLNACLLGRADLARDRIAEASAAATPNDPFDLAYSQFFAAILRLWLREYEQAEALAAQALARAERHEFPMVTAWSRVGLGWARAQRGRASEGIALIQQGIAAQLEIGTRTGRSSAIGVLAEAQACAGAVGDALATVEQALQANPDELVSRPEHLRLRGTLRLAQGRTELAAADFSEAIALASRMGAKTFELRATMSRARLLAQQGRRDEARTALTEIYNWFTEGFDTADLKEAKTLLEELKETGC
jgi:class 3 adenylate cyclase/tetratricopeptide (TPR) repeat protein